MFQKTTELLSTHCPGGPQPPILREVMVPILNNSDCERMYARAGQIQHIPQIFVCAGYQEGGKDSCDVRELIFTCEKRNSI